MHRINGLCSAQYVGNIGRTRASKRAPSSPRDSRLTTQSVSSMFKTERTTLNVSPSLAAGNGFRTYSQLRSASSGFSSSFPVAALIATLGVRHRENSSPRTDLPPRDKIFSKSHASTGCSCTGVAVASNILDVRGDRIFRNFNRLFGCGVSSTSESSASDFGMFLRRARWLSSTITHAYLRDSSESRYDCAPFTMMPCETSASLRGHFEKSRCGRSSSGSDSSIHARPFQRALGMPSRVTNSSCHCLSSGVGASTKIGKSSALSSAINSADSASCTVFPRPT